ncbi:MAG TPA: hydroxymethylbilane synthase [Candidatus Dormibacteraeota bacterium]|nr:hydroxymethylbilane synthase [Candidatus Dormibacteraeota bacterium]
MAAFRLATRGSALAMIQAKLAADALARRYPQHEFVLTPLTTHGDRHPSMRLRESPREGVFVKELEEALLDGRAELAVHSAKDLPTLPTPGLTLAAFLPRADARDVLISRPAGNLSQLPAGARLGTGSPRRAAQIAAVRPDLKSVEIRGNVDTRLRRLAEGEVDALVLAAAGLARLGRLEEAHQLLPFDIMLPAPGQGALAVQAIEGSEAARLAAEIDDPQTSRAVQAERALLRRLGGGCLSALGAYALVDGEDLILQAVVLEADGTTVIRAQARGRHDAEVVQAVAANLEAQGAARLLTRPGGSLAGLRIMVTRADRQAAALAEALKALGAEAVSCPVIAIEPIAVDPASLHDLDRYDWLVLTSANGVDRLRELLREASRDLPAGIKVAAIGPETAARAQDAGMTPTLVPQRFIAEELADALAAAMAPGARILLARAAGARDVLPDQLRARGARVDVLDTYRSVPPADVRPRLAACLPGVDIITFTSSSTVRHFVDAMEGALPDRVRIACIGPITAQTARDLGLRVDIIAQEYTTRGLVDAIVRSRTPIPA